MTARPASSPRCLDRRTFLAWSSAAAAVPFLGHLGARPALGQAGAAAVPTLPLSIGWIDGSDRWQRLHRVSTRLAQGRTGYQGSDRFQVLAADALIAGDQTLAGQSVRVKVHGLYPSAIAAHPGLGRARLTVLFPSHDPQVPGPFPFHAWAWASDPENVSAPLSFVTPLGIDGSLRMVLDVLPAARPHLSTRRGVVGGPPAVVRPARFLTDFTVDWYEGRPKLLTGAYLLGLSDGLWSSDRELPTAEEPRRQQALASLVVTVERLAPEE